MRFRSVVFTVCVSLLTTTALRADEDLGLKVPEGFTISKYADDTLAHDIFSMAIDTAGRVVVSGPGYVKILIDADRDGRAEKAIQYADGPRTGAQGMVFLGRDLLCTGDEGLIRFKDDDKDDKADGPPQTFLKLRTGGEHNAHAIRRGPDGHWYLLVGNSSQIDENYITIKDSPIEFPHGGLLLRLPADLSGAEVWGDCMRNAYDFDFNAQGEPFVYDSDGERDVSLPWYRPTRLFHVVRGGEHGWITDHWKRPDYYFDSPPVAASTGRGSPTGVVCYRHTQFPASYRNGMFLADWTFGRILFVPMNRSGSSWAGAAQTFVSTHGQFGFAPTDMDVGIDGSLYVCVGGRGTQGNVYRITYTGPEHTDFIPKILSVKETSPAADQLKACLSVQMPHSSWARARWIPLAKALGPNALAAAAANERLTSEERVRAVEILTEMFGGLSPQTLTALSQSKSSEVRARAAWSVGVTRAQNVTAVSLQPFMVDSDALVRRSAVEALGASKLAVDPVLPALAKAMNDNDRLIRLTAARMVPDMEPAAFKALSEATRQLGWRAAVTNGMGYVWRQGAKSDGFNTYGLELGRRILDNKNHPPELKLEAIRVIEASLADVGPDGVSPPSFDGFAAPIALKKYSEELAPIRECLTKYFPTGQAEMDMEMSRVAAMIRLQDPAFTDKVLLKLTADTDPVEDIHYLCVLAKTLAKPTVEQRTRVAAALVQLDKKLTDRKMAQDNNWKDRVGEVYGAICSRDPALPPALLEQPGFGRPLHVMFLSRLNEEFLPKAIELFTKAASADPDYDWNTDVVFVIGHDKSPEHFELIRQQFERTEVRMAVLMALSNKPMENDRLLFAEGLESGPIEVLGACLGALQKLPAKEDPQELACLVKLLRRLGADPSEYPLREQVVKLLERNAKVNFEFEYGEGGHRPQPKAVEQWTTWLNQKHKSAAETILGGSDVSLPDLQARLAKIDWKTGDAERGRKVFTTKGCAVCHSGGGNLGPDLAGVTGRFSRDDVFVAIAAPNRDVSPRYQTLLVETKQGKQYTGMLVYENVDGLVIRNAANQTYRIEMADVEARRPLSTSLMPNGLMNGLADKDLADLYRYLQSLNVQTAEGETEQATQ